MNVPTVKVPDKNELGGDNLRYHDYLKRKGTGRLFEKGYLIEEVAQFTGHRNINILWLVYSPYSNTLVHESVDKSLFFNISVIEHNA